MRVAATGGIGIAALCAAALVLLPAGRAATAGEPPATLLLDAYDPEGRRIDVAAFADYTNYFADDSRVWGIYFNYGVFPIGTPPATTHSGSAAYTASLNGTHYVALTMPAGQALYFTSLWKAPLEGVGTVFLRADNQGQGYVVQAGQSRVLELPFEFALSELAQAQRTHARLVATGATFPWDVPGEVAQHASRLAALAALDDKAARATASYGELALIMQLKERLVLHARSRTMGYRPDFLLLPGYSNWMQPADVTYFQKVRQAGFNAAHVVCNWSALSSADGRYDFSSLDYQIGQATSLGYAVVLNLMPSVQSLPGWAAALPFDQLAAYYYASARAASERYGPNSAVKLIYAAAELELGTRGLPVDQIAQLTARALQGARDGAPQRRLGLFVNASGYIGYQMAARAAGSNEFSTWDYLRVLRERQIVPDFVGLQAQYGTVFPPIDLQRLDENFEAIHAVFDKPIYIAESSASSRSQDFGIAAAFHWRSALDRGSQAQWADALLRIAYGTDYIGGLLWNRDTGYPPSSGGLANAMVGTSLVLDDGTIKPAYETFKRFADEMQARVRQSDCLFDWAAKTYPQYFAPASTASQSWPPYYYRQYATTANYLATSWADGHVWVLGPMSGNALLDVGPMSSYLAGSGCAP